MGALFEYYLQLQYESIIFAYNLNYMSTNIVNTIQTRLASMGMSQAQFAECVSATPAQMSIFLKERGSLSIDSLNKSLDLVGVNLSLYSNRNNLAKQVATFLLSKNVSSIDNWTKNDLAIFTQQKSISLLFDVQTEEEYIELERSGIIDIESTFPYFKALVSYYMSLNGVKPTASQAKQALATLLNEASERTDASSKQVGKIATGAAVGAFVVASPILNSVLAVAGLAVTKQVGAFSLFTKSGTSSLFAKAIDFIKK